MSAPRIAPMDPKDFSEAQSAFFKPFLQTDGSLHNVYATLAHHLDLAKAWSGFGLYTMRGSQMDPALREVAILRAAVNANCDYEFHHHSAIGRHVGLSDEDIDAIKAGTPLSLAHADLIVACVDELADQSKLSDENWTQMTETFGVPYTFDFILTVGAYSALALLLNTCGVEIESAGTDTPA